MAVPANDQILSLVTPIMQKFGVPGAAIAVVSGEDSAAIGYGIRDKEKGGTVTADTTFQLASCSKAYTATAIALLVDTGAMGWDDLVRKHLPEFNMHDERLSSLATVRDLLSMRLGYRKEGLVDWGRNLELGISYVFERLRYVPVLANFREHFTYLNAAYALSAEIVRRVSGKPLPEFLAEKVQTPLGQTNTFIHEGTFDPTRPHAFPHVELNEGILPIGIAHCGGRLGESCLYSSANDAARWMRLHLGKGQTGGKRLVSEAAMREMHRPHVVGPGVPALDNHFLAYAMGWQVRDTPHGPILLHEGGEFGVSTFTLLDPIRGQGAAVYANLNSSGAVKAASYALLELLAGREVRDRSDLFKTLTQSDFEALRTYIDGELAKHDPAPIALRDMMGSYFHPANGMIDVRETAEGIDARVRDGWVYDSIMEPLGDNYYRGSCRFRGTQSLARQGMRMRFFKDEQGIAVHAPGLGIARKVA